MDKAARRAIRITEITLLLAALGLFLVGTISGDTFYLRLATEALIFGGLALSVDLLLGIVGLLSLGQALYFGFGAYLSAVVLKEVSPSLGLSLLTVGLASAFLGYLASFIALRSKGVYFALITFGLAQIMAKAVYNTRELGASDGLIGVPVLQVWTPLGSLDTANPGVLFAITLLIIGLLYLALRYLLTTPMGQIWRGVQSNEHRLEFIGIDPRGPKRVAFVIAAVVAALSGALYPVLRGFVSPELLYFAVSGNAVITVILGGVGTLIGPIVGAVLLTLFKSVVGSFTAHHHIIVGIIFVIVVINAPKGLVGFLIGRLNRKTEGVSNDRE
jgi:branched-chain amino acid transport system permease protein